MKNKMRKKVKILSGFKINNNDVIKLIDGKYFTIYFNADVLHPAEQVKYIKKLPKNINILLVSNSPYAIQALRFYFQKTHKVLFFLKKSGNVRKCIGDNVFELLAIPLDDLICEEWSL